MLKIIHYPLLGLERKIRIYLPVDYENNSRDYPVLYMHDGQNVFEDREAIGGESLRLKEYLDQKKLGLIVVGIDSNTQENGRINEYCPWKCGKFSEKILEEPSIAGGKGKDYIDEVIRKLKPMIDREFRVNSDQTYMAGISLGGLITTYAACRYPKIVKKVATLSSAYYRNQEEIEKLIQASDLSTVEKFYMDCGTDELRTNDQISKVYLSSNESIYELVKVKKRDARFDVIKGAEHSYSFFRERVPEVLDYFCCV